MEQGEIFFLQVFLCVQSLFLYFSLPLSSLALFLECVSQVFLLFCYFSFFFFFDKF